MSTADHATFREQVVGLDNRFWIVNVMEMFERLAYYGVRAVVAIYMVLPESQGGPEFTHIQKGAIFAWWAGVQSVLPMFTGGFADRYGHKNTIAVAIVLKCLGYGMMAYLMDYSGFFWGCMFLAAGTAIFKPGVQGTLAATLKANNASVGWGIFYQLVNIGGFLGPVVAGLLRQLDWSYVFLACAGIVCINFLWLPFYKDPTQEEGYDGHGAKGAESWGMLSRAVTTNEARFWGGLILLLTPYLAWRDWTNGDLKVETLAAAMSLCAFVIYVPRKAHFDQGDTDALTVFAVSVVGLFQKRVLAFCVVFSGFWLMFNQVFDLLPNVIDDWVDSSGLIATAGSLMSTPIVPGILAVLLGTLVGAVCGLIVMLAMRPDHHESKDVHWGSFLVVGIAIFGACAATVSLVLGGGNSVVGVAAVVGALGGGSAYIIRPPAKYVAMGSAALGLLGGIPLIYMRLTESSAGLIKMAEEGAQVPPEWMINLNPALIVFTMIFFAYITSFVRPLTSIIIGMGVATAGSILAGTATVGFVCLAGVLVFSVGEMLSSPKKMEYLASLARKGQEGLFMGYANIPVAIGWIAGSYLAGDAYEKGGDKANLARKYLVEKMGMGAEEAEAIDRAEVVNVLASKLGQTAMDVQDLLYTTYDPSALWWNIGAIGLASIVGMIIYDRVLKAIGPAEAK